MSIHEHGPQGIEEFRAWCHRFEGLWRSLAIRLAWTRVANVEMVAHLHASLEVARPEDLARPPHDPSIENYHAEFHVLPPSELGRLLDELATGSLTIGERKIEVGGFDTHAPFTWRPLGHLAMCLAQRHDGHWLASADNAEAHLRATTHGIYEATQRVLDPDRRMKAQWNTLPAPFRDIDDVLLGFFGLRAGHDQALRSSAFVSFRAPVPICLTESTGFDGDQLHVEVSAPVTVDGDAVAVGLVANSGDSRRRLAFDTWEPHGSGVVARLSLPASEMHTYTLFLTYRGTCLEIEADSNPTLRPANPVLACHQIFEQSPEVAKRALRGEVKNGFEHAVGLLLHACGLPTLHYGKPLSRNEIDLVAILPERRIAVCIECTIDLPDLKNKLTKVYERSEAIRDTLADFEVLRAVATCSKTAVPEDQVQIAIEHETALLTRERLLELERRAHMKISTKDALAFIQGCIPVKDELGAAMGSGLFGGPL